MGTKYKKTHDNSTRLAIELGTELQIEIKEVISRFKSELVGMDKNSYLIAKLPQIINTDLVDKCKKYKGTDVIGRYLYRGTVFGFKSRLIDIITTPVNLLFVSYPTSVEEFNIRKHERVSCMLPGKIQFSKYVLDGTVLDLSLSGCQITIINPKFDIDILADQLAKIETLQFLFHLPGEPKGSVLHVIRKSVRKSDSKVSIGLEFSDLGAEMKNKIAGFIARAQSLNFDS